MYAVVTDDKLVSCDVQPDTYIHTYVVVTANKVVVMADKLLVTVDKVRSCDERQGSYKIVTADKVVETVERYVV